MNKLALVLAFIAFSGANALATDLPRLDEVKPDTVVCTYDQGDHSGLTSTHFVGTERGTPGRRGGGTR